MRIGLFDSGIGGLTVLKELKNKYPNNEYIYFGDNKNLPYGSKTKEQLFELSSNVIEFLLSKKVDIIIIACGTVSSTVYEDLKLKYNIPIYDIITPTINYINNSEFESVALMATQATVSSNKFKEKINKNFYQQACPLLVPFVEGDKSIDINSVLNEYLKEIKSSDAIILGCTHFTHIADEIKEIAGENIKVIDSREGVVNQAIKVELDKNSFSKKTNNSIINDMSFFVTSATELEKEEYLKMCSSLNIPWGGILYNKM